MFFSHREHRGTECTEEELKNENELCVLARGEYVNQKQLATAPSKASSCGGIIATASLFL